MDYYSLLGLPQRLNLDPETLRTRYYERSRLVHPDRGLEQQRREVGSSLEAAHLNKAYATLRNPVSRARHWLDLHGDPPVGDSTQIPQDVARLCFETQDLIASPTPVRDETLLAQHANVRRHRDRLLRELEDHFPLVDEAGRERDAVRSALRHTLVALACVEQLLHQVSSHLAET